MNRHTQLQFNLGIPPSPTNLATHFDSAHPRPVVIEKPVSAGGFKVVSANKLALAVRLAKRDLKLERIQPPSPFLCHVCRTQSPQHCPSCRVEQATPQNHLNGKEEDASDWSTVHATSMRVPQTPSLDMKHTKLEHRDASVKALLHPKTGRPCLEEMSVTLDEEPLVGKEGNMREDDRSCKEVSRLRTELHKQVTYLKQLRELGRGNVTAARRDAVSKIKRGKVRGGTGRVWMEEVKGEEEKLLRRKEEQVVRNARTIYNLSLQVSSLQRDIQKLQLLDTPSSSKKVHVCTLIP